MKRRDLLKNAALLAAVTAHPQQLLSATDSQSQGLMPRSTDRLGQGPFDIDQDEGWRTIYFSSPSEKPVRNPGLG